MSIPAQGAVGAETMAADWRDLLANPDQVNIEYLKRAPDGGNWHVGSPYSRRQMVAAGHEIERLRAALASPRADSDERTALGTLLVPDGWMLVPEEATGAMWEAGKEADGHPGDSYSAVWRAMVEARPRAPVLLTPAQPAGAVPDSLRALARDLMDFHDALDGGVGNGAITIRCESETEQTRRNFRAVLREAANALLASHPAGQSAGSALCSYVECAALGKSSCEDCRDTPRRDGQSAGSGAETVLISDGFSGDLIEVPGPKPAPDSTRTGQGEATAGEIAHAAYYGHTPQSLRAGWLVLPQKVRNNWERAAAALAARPAAPEAQGAERVRHVKRGSEYEVLHRGVELQVSVARGEPREMLETTLEPDPVCWEGDRLVIYQGSDGKIWAREEREFDDGRFVPAPPASSGQGGR